MPERFAVTGNLDISWKASQVPRETIPRETLSTLSDPHGKSTTSQPVGVSDLDTNRANLGASRLSMTSGIETAREIAQSK
jgi:hypothetical protein